jgi:hypothetical protein
MTESPAPYGTPKGNRFEQIEAMLLQLSQQQQFNTKAISQLSARVDRLTQNLSNLLGIVMPSLHKENTDQQGVSNRNFAHLGMPNSGS